MLGWPLAARCGWTDPKSPRRILFFSRSALFEHSVIRREGGRLSFAEKALVEMARQIDCTVECTKDGRVFERVTAPVGQVLPYGLAKPPFPLRQLRAPKSEELDEKGRYPLPVVLRSEDTQYASVHRLPVRAAGEAYRETRISPIDGSVQYHAVLPPRAWAELVEIAPPSSTRTRAAVTRTSPASPLPTELETISEPPRSSRVSAALTLAKPP